MVHSDAAIRLTDSNRLSLASSSIDITKSPVHECRLSHCRPMPVVPRHADEPIFGILLPGVVDAAGKMALLGRILGQGKSSLEGLSGLDAVAASVKQFAPGRVEQS